MRILNTKLFRSCISTITLLLAVGTSALADIRVSSLQVQTIRSDEWAKIEITARGVRIDGECYHSCSATFSFESNFGNSGRNEIRITQGYGQTVLSDFTPDHVWPDGTIATYISSSRYISRNNSEISNFTSDEQLFLGWLIANSEEIIEYAISTGSLSDRNARHWSAKAGAFERALRGRIRVLNDDIEHFPRDVTQTQLFENFTINIAPSAVQEADFRENTYRQLLKTIQPDLRDLGLYGGAIDGIIGPMTRSAILEFEQLTSRLEDGFIDGSDLIVLQNTLSTKQEFYNSLGGRWYGKVVCESGLEWNATLRATEEILYGQGPIQFPRLTSDDLIVTATGFWTPETIQISGVDTYNNKFEYSGDFSEELINASGTFTRNDVPESCSLILILDSDPDQIKAAVAAALGTTTVPVFIAEAGAVEASDEIDIGSASDVLLSDEIYSEAYVNGTDEAQPYSQAAAENLLADLEAFIQLNGNVYGVELVGNYNSVREIKESGRWNSELILHFEAFARFVLDNQDFSDYRSAQIALQLEEQQQELERYKETLRQLVGVGSEYAVNNPFNSESQTILDAITSTEGFEDSNSISDLEVAKRFLIETYQTWGVPFDTNISDILDTETIVESEAAGSSEVEFVQAVPIQTRTDTLVNAFDGKYLSLGVSTEQCESQYPEENNESRSLRIENDIMYGYESSCEMTNPVLSEDGNSISYDMKCSAEGNPYQYSATLTQDGVRLDILREGQIRSLYSCSPLIEREQKAESGEADDELPTLEAFRQTLVSECGSLDGVVDFSPDFETYADVTGDGNDEVILSLDGARCSISASYFCGANQCPTYIFQVNGDGALSEVFKGAMYEWKLSTVGDKTVFSTVTHGSRCGQSGAETCEIDFIWNGSEMEISDAAVLAEDEAETAATLQAELMSAAAATFEAVVLPEAADELAEAEAEAIAVAEALAIAQVAALAEAEVEAAARAEAQAIAEAAAQAEAEALAEAQALATLIDRVDIACFYDTYSQAYPASLSRENGMQWCAGFLTKVVESIYGEQEEFSNEVLEAMEVVDNSCGGTLREVLRVTDDNQNIDYDVGVLRAATEMIRGDVQKVTDIGEFCNMMTNFYFQN